MQDPGRDWSYQPFDPSEGELSEAERRDLVARIADRVGTSVSAKVQAAMEDGRPMTERAERVAASTEINEELELENKRRLRAGLSTLSVEAHAYLEDLVQSAVYGLGDLDALLNHPDVENIDCAGPHEVWVTFVGGKKVRWTPVARDVDDFIDLIRRAARRLGLSEVDFDARHPQLDLQLPDGSRLFAVYGGPKNNGVATQPLLSLRRHRYMEPTPKDLVDLGVWPDEVGRFVITAFGAGVNLIVGGDWGSGKTTLLRGVCQAAIKPWERTVTVEAGLTELGLHHSTAMADVRALFSRPPGPEGEGAISVRDLVMHATRRLNPTRVIIGEILGDEVGPVLDVFSGSTRGSACTIHARSSRSTINRFVQYGLMSEPVMPPEAVHYALGEAMPIIVHLAGDESVEGEMRRYCTSVLEVTGLDDGKVSSTELWGLNANNELVPRASLSSRLRARLARHGWDWTIDGWAHRIEPEGDLG